MWDRIEPLTAPAVEPLTLAEAKAQCRVDGSDSDTLLERLIAVAREKIEGPAGCGVAIMARQWRLSLDCMPPEIWIPMGPVLSVDEITYLDDGGTRQTLASAAYQWRKGRYEAYVRPIYNGTWPTVRRDLDSVQVTFTAGFAGTNDSPVTLTGIPAPLRHAMLLLVTHYHDNRASVAFGGEPHEMPLGVENILNQYRVGRF